ncbi:MAG: 30S ribosomal protein S16 [Candidatus Nealsonbacteria bacterium CG_4_9_14_0_2_um_filter_37_38]|uniref:Small ribosomal subunit protein bS16 n=1 Tax=Candidatus Nealsonbacteria bacterium CG_4_10_14_0_8_um_filter_37_14 TaxID=1974684 RepID=A0A2M7R6W4_9BACT|nr:MAG: 30S ribosomal protein S16 [Candidatus Nealsonbacteria bacterium CG11_big_fil_rev_8_21_14_0_20_37_68]PIW91950.1 MAG: 30S ribosomal protein S16 [Candidatus Nealsonbacteria bacterium CG_4_8_14_3_um_filter_37_23]PIY89450.1 MAG: 30S ribosomal protein S16 [Candidatus Nealsonbacteria bacterium CG_4_10_14_0_8_um_filter_37_14]PJC51816.1 MAG: 30S ribosomal protein S16 [Candidatus Nealsonbacteria bacterium CG_4_9_14_0_2_um_filter_37_38]
MLVIRLFRIGKKNQPFFKIVVTDKRKPPRGGRFVQEVGFYNPLTKEKNLKKDRIKYWLSVGAKPSATVYNMLISEKIIEGRKVDVHKESKKEKKEGSVAEAAEGKEIAEGKKEKSAGEKPTEEEPKKDYNPPTTSSRSPEGERAPETAKEKTPPEGARVPETPKEKPAERTQKVSQKEEVKKLSS